MSNKYSRNFEADGKARGLCTTVLPCFPFVSKQWYFKEEKKRETSLLAPLSIRLIPSARYLWSVCNFKRSRVFDSSFFLFRCYFSITLYKRKSNEWEIVDSNVVNKQMNEKNMKIEKEYHFLVIMSKPMMMSRILCNWRQRVHSSSTGQSALSLFSIYLSFFVSR